MKHQSEPCKSSNRLDLGDQGTMGILEIKETKQARHCGASRHHQPVRATRMNRHGARLVYRDFVRRFADDADVAAGNGGLVTMRPEKKKNGWIKRRRGVNVSAYQVYHTPGKRQAVYNRASP